MTIGQRSCALEPGPHYLLSDFQPGGDLFTTQKLFRLLQNFERRGSFCRRFPGGAHSFNASATQRVQFCRAAIKKGSSAYGGASTIATRLEHRRHAINDPSASQRRAGLSFAACHLEVAPLHSSE